MIHDSMSETCDTVGGTVHTISVALVDCTTHALDPTVTVGELSLLKPAPVSVRGTPPPAEPLAGEMAVTAACWVKEMVPSARPTPGSVTTTAAAPIGASPRVQLMLELSASTTVQFSPPMVTLGTPVNPLPLISTTMPAWPEVGRISDSVGATE